MYEKRFIMKNLTFNIEIILIAIGFLFINACDSEIDINYNITGDWRVVSYENYETSTVITKTEDNPWDGFNGGDVIVNFTETDLTSGVISGIKVTNSFWGEYTINTKGGITIGDICQTEINEPECGTLFNSITDAETYKVRNDQLIIFYNRKKNSITLEKLNE